MNSQEFHRLIAAVGPFESNPHVAVAVSGGADSLALALLVNHWVRSLGGQMIALTVDHGLRTGATAEAARVGRWLKGRGIAHHILTWVGDKPRTGIQAAARTARYRLLAAACRQAAILHLLSAHHLEDQAETFLLRLGRSSGIDGLAAMPGVVETDGVRLLRPLLGVPKERLKAVLHEHHQDWIEDPSNENRDFARIRIRQSLPDLAMAGVSATAMVETAAHMARARVALEATASDLLARCAAVHPVGFAEIDGQSLFEAPEEISLRALSRVLMCVGGGIYPAALQKRQSIHEKMKACLGDRIDWKGATLGRCRIVPGSTGRFLVMREMRHLPDRQPVSHSGDMHWDYRFRLRARGPVFELDRDESRFNHNTLSIAPLGRQGLRQAASDGAGVAGGVPKPALWSLPAVFDGDIVVQVPHLNFRHPDLADGPGPLKKAAFFPRQSLSGAGFAIAE